MRLKKAIKILFKELRKDKELYYAWQSNIAMAFKDKYFTERKNKRYLNNEDIHNLANDAARNFLNLLIRNKKKNCG